MSHRRAQKQKAKIEREAKKARAKTALDQAIQTPATPDQKRVGHFAQQFLNDPSVFARKMVQEGNQ